MFINNDKFPTNKMDHSPENKSCEHFLKEVLKLGHLLINLINDIFSFEKSINEKNIDSHIFLHIYLK